KTSSITAGDYQAYTAAGFDSFGNSLGDQTSETTFSIVPDGSCAAASCTASTVGDHTVTGTDAGKTDTASLKIGPGSLDHITISPPSSSITAGDSQTYTAQGFDGHGNSLGDVTPTTFSIAPDGACTNATCAATLAGAHTVTGSIGSATDTSALTVNPGVLDHITISPPSSSIVAGGSQAYTAQGFDAYGNPLGDVTRHTTFGIAPDGSCDGAMCTATAAGAHTI